MFVSPSHTDPCSLFSCVSVKGGILPAEFWSANEHGVKGGIELAFMSTTLDRKVAKSFASGTDNNTPSIVFEIQMGMIDRGADVQWCSQFAGEKEILFAPLTGLEVAGTPKVEGSTIVVGLRLNCNLHDATIEEVTSKMKKTHQDLTRTVRTELVNSGFEDLTSFDENVQKYLDCDGPYFNSANNYKEATMATLDARIVAFEVAFPSVKLQCCVEAQEVDYANVLDKQQRSGPKFAVVLGNLLPLNKSLTRLDASGLEMARKLMVGRSGDNDYDWEFDMSGISLLMQGLVSCSATLCHLSLSGNKVGADGAKLLLPQVVAQCVLLLTLNVAGMGLEQAGVAEFADALSPNSMLTDLNISDNNAGPQGAQSLARAVKVGYRMYFRCVRDRKYNVYLCA